MTHLCGLSAPGHVAVLIHSLTTHAFRDDRSMLARFISLLFALSGGVASFPARRRMRGFEEGGRHLSGGYR